MEDSTLTVIKASTVIESVGTNPKRIEEYVRRVNSDTEALSIAKIEHGRMVRTGADAGI